MECRHQNNNFEPKFDIFNIIFKKCWLWCELKKNNKKQQIDPMCLKVTETECRHHTNHFDAKHGISRTIFKKSWLWCELKKKKKF